MCREGGQNQRHTRLFTSRVLVTFVVFYHPWQKDICRSDWPQTSLKTAVGRNVDSLQVGVQLFERSENLSLERTLGDQDLQINISRHKWLLQEPLLVLMRKSMNNSNTLSVSFMFISLHLKKFTNINQVFDNSKQKCIRG